TPPALVWEGSEADPSPVGQRQPGELEVPATRIEGKGKERRGRAGLPAAAPPPTRRAPGFRRCRGPCARGAGLGSAGRGARASVLALKAPGDAGLVLLGAAGPAPGRVPRISPCSHAVLRAAGHTGSPASDSETALQTPPPAVRWGHRLPPMTEPCTPAPSLAKLLSAPCARALSGQSRRDSSWKCFCLASVSGQKLWHQQQSILAESPNALPS
ncbi:PREDICTED: uncharacterized protein LOC102024236, partial [Chinchilla lanigera]|uniref:uncharacterized protein LOC102024236 n=1 Tax=Chinchilla lanigera TaxID=34839 RepID=UPI0006991105